MMEPMVCSCAGAAACLAAGRRPGEPLDSLDSLRPRPLLLSLLRLAGRLGLFF